MSKITTLEEFKKLSAKEKKNKARVILAVSMDSAYINSDKHIHNLNFADQVYSINYKDDKANDLYAAMYNSIDHKKYNKGFEKSIYKSIRMLAKSVAKMTAYISSTTIGFIAFHKDIYEFSNSDALNSLIGNKSKENTEEVKITAEDNSNTIKESKRNTVENNSFGI